jgi:hypothetical protein
VSGWADLDRELDAWGAAGAVATLWWRDDDAVAATPALDRLLDIAMEAGAPLALAVIPALAEPALAERLRRAPRIAVLQHGYAHLNHAPAGAKKAEFGPGRAPAAAMAELAAGRDRLAHLFDGGGTVVLPVLVPPWNRIAPAAVRALPGLGFAGLSVYRARAAAAAAPGIAAVNVHADVIDWRGDRGFVGEAAALRLIVDHLRARRRGAVDGREPTGLLTHHLVHDDDTWRFTTDLVRRVAEHPAARWLDASTVFAPRQAAAAEA